MIDKIGNSGSGADSRSPYDSELERVVISENASKRRIVRSVLSSAGIVIGVFLMLAVVIITTTDIKLTDFDAISSILLDLVLLLFVSYSMYVCCSDSGMRKALSGNAYQGALEAFEALKGNIICGKMQGMLHSFCRHYVKTELESIRTYYLADVGLEYEAYKALYIGKDEKYIKGLSELSAAQKKAVVKANNTKPIKLTPEMIMKRGRGSGGRSPLGVSPEAKRKAKYSVKFLTSFATSLGMSVIVLEPVMEPTWIIVCSCAVKLILVIFNGFMGYKFGYENIAVDTVDYIGDQSDILSQAIDYISKELNGAERAKIEPSEAAVNEKEGAIKKEAE